MTFLSRRAVLKGAAVLWGHIPVFGILFCRFQPACTAGRSGICAACP